mgnify:CR=1 FL=1
MTAIRESRSVDTQPSLKKMLEGTEILLNTDYKEFTAKNGQVADKVLYTGMIDEYYDYKLGVLEYRSVRFEQERYEMENYQGNAVVNYTDRESSIYENHRT